jgi:trimeric autotransporter adhesin
MAFIIGSSGNDTLTGTAADDIIQGLAGDDTIDGGGGRDFMAGGAGNDTFVVNSVLDEEIENANEGFDTVNAFVSHTLSANIEVLALQGGSAINGTGNAQANILVGNSAANTLTGAGGDDTIDGGLGNDVMIGGAGNDTFVVNASGDQVQEASGEGIDLVTSTASTFSLDGSAVENLTLLGTGNNNGAGNGLANTITGNSGFNFLSGGAGNDTMLGNGGVDFLDGGSGIDRLVGGTGNDTYFIDTAGDLVIENAGEGLDHAKSSVSYTLTANVEILTLIGTGAISGAGNALDNIISGNDSGNILQGATGNDSIFGADGSDVLFGGGGADSLAGGLGGDTFNLDDLTDVITENPGEGDDTVLARVSGVTLAANVETAFLIVEDGGSLFGNDQDNLLIATIISSNPDPEAGADQIFGFGGNDAINGGSGNDTLDGGTGNDVLEGGFGDDTLLGGDHADTLFSGTGNDEMFGQRGNDTFVYTLGDGDDLVGDFEGAGVALGDVILLQDSAIAGITDFAGLLAATVDVAGGCEVTFATGQQLSFRDVAKAQLDAADFIFS